MLYKEIQKTTKAYLSKLAKENEAACAVLDSLSENAEIKNRISDIESLLKTTTVPSARKPLKKALGDLKSQASEESARAEAGPLKCIYSYTGSELYAVIPLTAKSLKYSVVDDIKTDIDSVARDYGFELNHENKYLVIKGKTTSSNRNIEGEFNTDDFFEQLGKQMLSCEELCVYDFLENTVKQGKKSKKPAQKKEQTIEEKVAVKPGDDSGVFTVAQVADALGWAPSTVHSVIQSKELRAQKQKVPDKSGKMRKQRVIKYDDLIDFRKTLDHTYDACEVKEDISKGCSDKHIMAFHGISERHLGKLKKDVFLEKAEEQDINPGELGYFTIEELLPVLIKSRASVQNYIRSNKLPAAQRKVPGKRNPMFTVSYEDVVAFKNMHYDNAFQTERKKTHASAAKMLKKGHSDLYVLANLFMKQDELDELKKGLNSGKSRKKSVKNKSQKPNKAVKQKIIKFFKDKGTDQEQFQAAKKKFNISGRVLHAIRLNVQQGNF